MAVPKRRQSKSKTRKRRSHHAVKPVQMTRCPQCGDAVRTHVVCPNCSYYQGREMMPEGTEG